MFYKYSPPSEGNTHMISGRVTDVYHGVPVGEVVVVLSDGTRLQLVYPFTVQGLYSAIGYDDVQLAELLVGNVIQCRRMTHLPWAVEINAGDTKIDNYKLTAEEITLTRVVIVILTLVMLAFAAWGEMAYIYPKYRRYVKAEKKRARKLKQN